MPSLLPTQRDPRFAEAGGIGAALLLLDQLTTLIAIAPGDRFSYDLLGISPGASSNAAVKRLDALWTQLDRASRQFEESYGETTRPDRPR